MRDLAPKQCGPDRRFQEDDLMPIKFPPDVQNNVDRLLSDLKRGDDRRDHPAFQPVTEWLEEHEDELGILGGDFGESIEAIDLTKMSILEDQELREYLGLSERAPITDRLRLKYMRKRLEEFFADPSLLDADVHPGCFLLPIRARNGTRAKLAGGVRGYSFTIITFDWFGVFKSNRDFENGLMQRGLVTSASAFARLPIAQRLGYWTR
jgi:hypothetical protein